MQGVSAIWPRGQKGHSCSNQTHECTFLRGKFSQAPSSAFRAQHAHQRLPPACMRKPFLTWGCAVCWDVGFSALVAILGMGCPSSPPSWRSLCSLPHRMASVAMACLQVSPDRRTRVVVWDARFLALAAILGAGCTAAYYVTGGSLVAAALAHWLPVQLWLFLLGGLDKTQPMDAGAKKE